MKVGKSSFAKLCPAYVLLSSDTSSNVCICQKHANNQFMLEKIPDLSERCSEFIELSVCSTTKECLFGLCSQCKDL